MYHYIYAASVIVGVLVTIVFLVMRVMRGGIGAMFIKAGASVCFIGTAFSAFAFNNSNMEYGILVIMGLIFGLLGDVWLDMKYVYKQHNHIAYQIAICHFRLLNQLIHLQILLPMFQHYLHLGLYRYYLH